MLQRNISEDVIKEKKSQIVSISLGEFNAGQNGLSFEGTKRLHHWEAQSPMTMFSNTRKLKEKVDVT